MRISFIDWIGGETMSIVHLHTYSAYSLLSSTITPENLVREAKRKGFSQLALTDRNVLYGVIPFYKACIAHGIKPIIGLTADILKEEGIEAEACPLILLAKNEEGYKNLLKISSSIQTKSEKGIPIKWLKHYTTGLIAITPGIEGEIEQYILQNQLDQAKETILYYKQLFEPDSFYISIQPYPFPKNTKLVNELVQLSERLAVPLVATNLIQFLNKEDYFAWKCLLAIKENKKISDMIEKKIDKESYFKSPEEMEALYQQYPDALKNTVTIANQCQVTLTFNQQLLPKYPLENQSSDEYLTKLCYKGLREKVKNASSVYEKRLEYELSIIKQMNFSDYFLIVWDYVQFAKKNGIVVGPGRGSAAGSLVAYCLGITEVDPIRFNLLFERFLNPERVSMPDIDVDFSDHRRDEVIDYVAKKYGYNHVAQIITFGTFQTKAALRDVARVFGLSTKEIDQLSKSIPNKLGITLKEALDQSESLQTFLRHEKIKQIYEIACKIEGLPRHTSTHAAGIVISDFPLIECVPLQQGSTNVLLTQFPMGILEEIGLLKMDLLGLRNLSLIESILREINYNEQKKIQLKSISFQDEKTFKLLQHGMTTGVFQLESEGMRNVLKRLKPTEFEDIVAVNALYRPGPMANIQVYINRKHGKEPIVYPHPDLEPVLKKTYGVIVYQEQIMQIASQMAGFSLGEADLLRRAVSKKNRDILNKERMHFVTGAVKNGYSEKTANDIYDLIVRFSDYGFNRSHAVAYSVIAYQLAYLKAHFPLYYMAALLTSVIGNEKKLAEYIKELRIFGYALKGPSINKSEYPFTVENDGIRFSLAAIKGVGVQALKEIIRARKDGPFTDLFDFCMRVSLKVVNRKTIENLIYSGSMDEFGYDRAILLATLDVAIEHASLMKPENQQMDFSLMTGLDIKPKYVDVEPMPLEYKLEHEKKVLGIFISKHPVSVYRGMFKMFGTIFLDELEVVKQRYSVGVYIQDERKIRTKKGELMAFLEISDETSDFSAVVFPSVYKRKMIHLQKGAIVLLDGYFEYRNGQKQFVILDVTSLDDLKNSISEHRLYIKVSAETESNEWMNSLKEIIYRYKGKTPVILFYEKTRQTIQLTKDLWVDEESEALEKMKALFGAENVVLK